MFDGEGVESWLMTMGKRMDILGGFKHFLFSPRKLGK